MMKWICRAIIVLATITDTIVVTTTVRAQSLTTFRVANGTSGENPAVLWVGVDQGIYRKHGLNVEVIFMRTGPLAMSALVSGDVSAVLTSSNNVLNVAAGGLDVVARQIHFIIDSIREVFSLACSVREGPARLALALVSQ